DQWPYLAFSVIENHYMANGCFLEEGQLMNNTDKIKHIKTILVNGRYDVICPPITAYELYQKLDNSQLVIVEQAGHSASEPGIEKALVKAVLEFE
ncbi:MAG: alpha/beta hydrolase, partial [bacterium]|nr:alpha/beta hydrolase [bacterium]